MLLLCFRSFHPIHDIYCHIAINFDSPMAKPESCLIVKIRQKKKDSIYANITVIHIIRIIEKAKTCNHNSLIGKRKMSYIFSVFQ